MHFDAGAFRNDITNFLRPDDVLKIENLFEEYEKVSLSFLFYDDINTCFEICEKIINIPSYCCLSENKFFSYIDCEKKILEYIFYLKNFLILEKLGLGEYEAERRFKYTKFVSKRRFLFYEICESLTNEETFKVMKSFPSLTPEKYLEMYILKVLKSENNLEYFLKSLYSTNNLTIYNILKWLGDDLSIKESIYLSSLKQSLPVPDKSDKIYPIKDPLNVGLCFIINEFTFQVLYI